MASLFFTEQLLKICTLSAGTCGFHIKVFLVCLKSNLPFLLTSMKMISDLPDFTESGWRSQAQILFV
jgi:hypothetical protein